MNHQQNLIASLELASERAGDLTPMVYARYFEKCPESRELMWHLDQLVKGKMLAEIFRLLMESDLDSEDAYLDFEVRTHQQSYGVLGHMYDNLMAALAEAVAEVLDSDWTQDFAAAWEVRTKALLQAISGHLAK